MADGNGITLRDVQRQIDDLRSRCHDLERRLDLYVRQDVMIEKLGRIDDKVTEIGRDQFKMGEGLQYTRRTLIGFAIAVVLLVVSAGVVAVTGGV